MTTKHSIPKRCTASPVEATARDSPWDVSLTDTQAQEPAVLREAESSGTWSLHRGSLGLGCRLGRKWVGLEEGEGPLAGLHSPEAVFT
jgi:hypothetical protein